MSEAINQLKNHQQQLDADGVMVGVSRQALEEVLERIAALEKVAEAAKPVYEISFRRNDFWDALGKSLRAAGYEVVK